MTTNRILKSSLGPRYLSPEEVTGAFHVVVTEFCRHMQEWHDHHLIVSAQKDLAPLVAPKWEDYQEAENPKELFETDMAKYSAEAALRHDPYPAPSATPDIVDSIKTVTKDDGSVVYQPDFEIENDDEPWPDDETILRTYKDDLLHRLSVVESSAMVALLPPPGKRRLYDSRYNEIMREDAERHTTIMSAAKTPEAQQDVISTINHDELRSDDDTRFATYYRNRTAKIASLHQRVTLAMSEIEDLTLDTIGKFELPTLEV